MLLRGKQTIVRITGQCSTTNMTYTLQAYIATRKEFIDRVDIVYYAEKMTGHQLPSVVEAY